MVGVRRDQQWLNDYLAKSGSRSACTGADLALARPSPAGADKAGTNSSSEGGDAARPSDLRAHVPVVRSGSEMTGQSAGVDAFLARSEMEKRRVGAFEDEVDLQVAVAEFLDLAMPENARWFHVPNGELRHPAVAGRLKAMGVKPGVGDVIVLHGPAYIWVELKTSVGKLSDDQVAWRAFCKAHGSPWALCRSVLEVEDFLRACGLKLRATLR